MSVVKRLFILLLIVVIALSVAGCSILESPEGRAARDFKEKLELAQAQQSNVAYTLNLTSGQVLDQPSMEATLDAQYVMIGNLAVLTDAANASAEAYLRYLKPDSSEYANVTAWQTQMSDYLASARGQYNSGAAMYNQFWSGVNGSRPVF